MVMSPTEWVPQRHEQENPLAVVKNLFRYHHVRITDTAVETQLPTMPAYPSLGAIRRFLEAWDFTTMGVKVTPEQLASVVYPAIASLHDNQCILLVDAQPDHVLYVHPCSGWREESLAAFLPKWSGHVLMAVPGEHSAEADYASKRHAELVQQHNHPRRQKVTVLDAFLTPAECAYLINLAAPRYKRSSVITKGEARISDTRTSSSASLPVDDALLQTLYQRSAALLEAPAAHFEPLQCVAYAPNQEFRPHYDAFGEHSQHEIAADGQRITTILFYLNADFLGGETFFPNLNLRLTPHVGRAVVFHNVDTNGQIDPDSLHAGLSVFAGTKYVATLWLRDRPWGSKTA